MKVFKVRDYIESYYLVYNIVVANTKEDALKVIKKKSYDESYFTLEDIEEILNMVRKTAKSRNVTVEFEDNSSECILGDRDKFYQLVLNLVENATKYSKEKGGYVKISSYNEAGYYYLIVKDNGIGIPDEDISRIFERFYRVDKSRKKGGTGLGLAIVKHIVKIFNGEINVKSKLGEGSTFEVKIPYL